MKNTYPRSSYHQMMKQPLLARRINTPIASNSDFHLHDNYELFLFLNGKAEMFVENSQYTLRPGSLLAMNDHEIHKATNLSDISYERINIHFDPSLLQPFLGLDTNLLSCFQNHKPGISNMAHLDGERLSEFCKLADKLIMLLQKEKNVYGKDVLTMTCLAELLVIANDSFQHTKGVASEPLSDIITATISYIEENLESILTVESIAEHLSINKFYLSHRFKDQTGGSLYHYILTKKLVLAKTLLLKGQSVKDICESTGFNSYNNFIRTFKNHTGYSPGQYKKMFSKDFKEQ